ncbi:GerAB/ArcD/ProY family transporter [Paenibacillus arenilitoris]|uniref:Endospore germination permease n=1 Tax=Paenibacillus arenilitoris TaxID=2772299 RepID=A0A927H8H6_9BACL|nr:endospore germination permease [Paenibacillus arenilitoris]MBD2872090.1 endospore germination permease [Paenibacillus arenilitoris]
MKVSGYQLFWMVSISSMIVFSYLPIHLAAEQSLQDCWISILLGTMIMLGATWITLRVCMQNKDKTFVQFINDLIGTVLGKVVVTMYFLLWFMQMSFIAKGTVEFQNLVMLHNTPMLFILLCLLFLVLYAVYKGGITAISRCAEIIGPFFVFMLYVQLFLNPQDMDATRILPVYADSGLLRILSGTLHSFNYMVDPSIILMLFFFAENKRSATRGIFWGTAVAMLWGVVSTLVLLFVTGPNIAAELVVPIYSLTKFVSILNFIQNIDAFFIPLWLFGAFIKLSIYLFILSYGLSEWTGYRNWKLIACLTTFIWLAYTIYSTHNIQISNTLKNRYLIGLCYPMVYIVFPLFLWMIGLIRQRRKPSSVN